MPTKQSVHAALMAVVSISIVAAASWQLLHGVTAQARPSTVVDRVRSMAEPAGAVASIDPVAAESPAPDKADVPPAPVKGAALAEALALSGPERVSSAVYDLVFRLAARYGIDPYIVAAVVWKESRWNPRAVGDHGKSIGLMQLHADGVGYGLSVSERADPEYNLEVGIRALRIYADEFGSIEAALAAHNAGRGALLGAGGDWRKLFGGLVAEEFIQPVLERANLYRRYGIIPVEDGLDLNGVTATPTPANTPSPTATARPVATPTQFSRTEGAPLEPATVQQFIQATPTPPITTDPGSTRATISDLDGAFRGQ